MTNRTVLRSHLLWTASLRVVVLLLFAVGPGIRLLAASEEEEGLTTQEMESLSKAKDPEQKLKIYLDIASHRMKEVIQFAGKQDKENTPKAVKAYQTACSGAEKCVVGAGSDPKISRKMMETLFRTMRGYNTALVSAMGKTPDDFRPQIEAAFNVSTAIQQGMSVRVERYGIK
jgi:hypothetical protein